MKRSINLSIFDFSDYKLWIQKRIEIEDQSWGILTRLSKAAKCQRPYLTKVLKGEADLTPSQAFGVSRFWQLSEDETEYFMRLLEIQRAGSAEYRSHLVKKAELLRTQHQELGRLVERPASIVGEKDLLYYSSWIWTCIHILISIPAYQTVAAIAERLSVPSGQVRQILISLEQFGFARQDRGKWKFSSLEQHIPKESPLATFHHSNWRQRAMLDSQEVNPESIHFTVVQSLSKKDYERIKKVILDCIQEVARISGPSAEEELMCFTCDLFQP